MRNLISEILESDELGTVGRRRLLQGLVALTAASNTADAYASTFQGVGLNHLPSGRFGANAAWFTLNVIAHNLSRWVSRIGLGETLITHKTLRRRYLQLPGRLTRSARRETLHLPQRWPWHEPFLNALANLRAVVLVT